jgi:hypothetical protein
MTIERVERDEEHVTLRSGELWAIVRYDRDHGDDSAGWVVEYSDGDSSQCPDSREDGIVRATDWLRSRLKRDAGQGRRHYTYRMPWGDLLHVSARLEEASAPIEYGELCEDGDITWHSTSLQSASVGHSEVGMLRAVVEQAGSDWYAAPGEDHAEALERAIEGAQLIREKPLRG